MFYSAMRDLNLLRDYDPDKMHWQKANMINTIVPPHELEKIRDKAWEEINDHLYTDYKKGMLVDKNSGEIHKIE